MASIGHARVPAREEGQVLEPLRDVEEPTRPGDVAVELADLRQEIAGLREAVRARDDFIAIAAHELRNPMTPIIGVAELALAAAQASQGVCPPRITDLLRRLQLLAHDFIKRSTRLLDVSRIEAGNLQLERCPTDLSSIVRSAARSYEAMAARARSPLVLDVQDGVTSLGDGLAVEQVVENLLSNALKFGAGKPVAIHLRSDGRSATLRVRDLGIGMSTDQQARIFARFEQVMTHHKGSGFGVGLWVANRLVAAMDGEISVSSVMGEGSTFTVTFLVAHPTPDRTTP